MEILLFVCGLIATIVLSTIGFFIIDTLSGIRKSADAASKNFDKLSECVGELKIEVVKMNGKLTSIIEKTERNVRDIDDIKSRESSVRERIHSLANDINGIYSKIDKE